MCTLMCQLVLLLVEVGEYEKHLLGLFEVLGFLAEHFVECLRNLIFIVVPAAVCKSSRFIKQYCGANKPSLYNNYIYMCAFLQNVA